MADGAADAVATAVGDADGRASGAAVGAGDDDAVDVGDALARGELVGVVEGVTPPLVGTGVAGLEGGAWVGVGEALGAPIATVNGDDAVVVVPARAARPFPGWVVAELDAATTC